MQESEIISNAPKVDDQTRPGSIVRVPEPAPPPNSPSSIPHTHGYQRLVIFNILTWYNSVFHKIIVLKLRITILKTNIFLVVVILAIHLWIFLELL